MLRAIDTKMLSFSNFSFKSPMIARIALILLLIVQKYCFDLILAHEFENCKTITCKFKEVGYAKWKRKLLRILFMGIFLKYLNTLWMQTFLLFVLQVFTKQDRA